MERRANRCRIYARRAKNVDKIGWNTLKQFVHFKIKALNVRLEICSILEIKGSFTIKELCQTF